MSTHTTPLLTVDIIIELEDKPDTPIVLIKRRYPPPGWAIPGGFVDEGESVEDAAMREALEETSLTVCLRTLLGCYSEPSRDPRGHTATIVYIATATGEPEADDDAAEITICNTGELPHQLAFDHSKILRDYVNYREKGALPDPYCK